MPQPVSSRAAQRHTGSNCCDSITCFSGSVCHDVRSSSAMKHRTTIGRCIGALRLPQQQPSALLGRCRHSCAHPPPSASVNARIADTAPAITNRLYTLTLQSPSAHLSRLLRRLTVAAL